MSSLGNIQAGGVSVKLSADTAQMERDLKVCQERVSQVIKIIQALSRELQAVPRKLNISVSAGNFASLRRECDDLRRSLERMQRSAGRSETGQQGAGQAEHGQTHGASGPVALIAVGAAALGAYQGVKRATSAFAEFEGKMLSVRAVTQTGAADMQKLTKQAMDLGASTTYSSSQVADTMISLGRMGYTTSEIQNSVAPVMALAKATDTGLAASAEIAANNMRVFRMEAGQMGHIADILTVTANGSAQTLADLGEALKYAGPAAQAAGEDFKDVNAALGVMANLGIRGSQAGTGLRTAYLRMADPKVQAMLKGHGVTTVDGSGNMRRMADIITDLAKAMQSLPNAQRLVMAKQLFEVEGTPTGLGLVGGVQGLNDFRARLDNAAGAAQRNSDIQTSGFGSVVEELDGSLEKLSITAGKLSAQLLALPIQRLTVLLSGLADFLEENPFVAKVTGMALGLGTTGVALSKLNHVCKGLGSGFSTLAQRLHVSKGALGAFTAGLLAISAYVGHKKGEAGRAIRARWKQDDAKDAVQQERISDKRKERESFAVRKAGALEQMAQLRQMAADSAIEPLTKAAAAKARQLMDQLDPGGRNRLFSLNTSTGRLSMRSGADRELTGSLDDRERQLIQQEIELRKERVSKLSSMLTAGNSELMNEHAWDLLGLKEYFGSVSAADGTSLMEQRAAIIEAEQLKELKEIEKLRNLGKRQAETLPEPIRGKDATTARTAQYAGYLNERGESHQELMERFRQGVTQQDRKEFASYAKETREAFAEAKAKYASKQAEFTSIHSDGRNNISDAEASVLDGLKSEVDRLRQAMRELGQIEKGHADKLKRLQEKEQAAREKAQADSERKAKEEKAQQAAAEAAAQWGSWGADLALLSRTRGVDFSVASVPDARIQRLHQLAGTVSDKVASMRLYGESSPLAKLTAKVTDAITQKGKEDEIARNTARTANEIHSLSSQLRLQMAPLTFS